MFEKSAALRSKDKILVHFLTSGSTVVEGEVTLTHGASLGEFLNGDDPFIEVETGAGDVRLVAKNSIVEAREVMRQPADRRGPYAILRIQKGASVQEVRDAWTKRLKACHPDRMAALGVDQEIEYAARKATQKINMAYNEIISAMRERAKQLKTPAGQTAGENFSVYY